MATYGKYPVDWAKEATLRAAVPTYDMGMYEQNVLIYRITSDPRMLEKVGHPAPPCCSLQSLKYKTVASAARSRAMQISRVAAPACLVY